MDQTTTEASAATTAAEQIKSVHDYLI